MSLIEPKDPVTLQTSKEPRINDTTFCSLFDDHSQFDNFMVIDCRSEREYEGGHIKNAVRCHPFEKSDNIRKLYRKYWRPQCCFVFHCEFSAYRGPSSYRIFLEEHQKSGNGEKNLHAFVLDGGFSVFYPKHQDYCVGTYVPEVDQEYN